MVVDLFLKCNNMYEPVVENRIYKKRSENGVVVQQGGALAARNAAYAEQDVAPTAHGVANTTQGAFVRPISSKITTLLRAFSLRK